MRLKYPYELIKSLLFLQPNTVSIFTKEHASIPLSPILIELQPPPPPQSIYATEHNNFHIFFFEKYPIAFLQICIPNNGLKWHNPAPYVYFSKSRLTPPPPPLSHIHTYPPFSISPSFFRSAQCNPSYPTNRSNTPNRV